MDDSNQNLDTTEISSKTHVKNLWKEANNNDYQEHATIFSDDSTQIINSASLNVDSTDTFMQALDNKIKSDKDDEIVKSWLFEQLETTINDSSEKALYQYLYDTITESDEPSFTLKKVNIMDLEKRKKVYGICGECNEPVALKSLDDSSNMNNDFLNEIKYYISGHFYCIQTVICYGITKDPDTKDYMMVLPYYGSGSLRNNLTNDLGYENKIQYLYWIIDGLSTIHNAGKVHKDFHSGNVLIEKGIPIIKPVNSTDSLSETISSTPANPISECFDCELDESDLNQDNDE
ncbi:kinase-like domain-containing protein [Rhizophagus irregularis DAOM 181602=DAOM 197198]|nr:kinase-like domain-containing protein [Rhizophagus irregularis DAOM 181602=DAOM 197198]